MSTVLVHNQSVVINPRWLTMIYGSGDCQVCATPQGNTHTYYLNIRYNCNDKFGFLVCGKEECNLFIKSYIKNLYNDIYTTKLWKRILHIYANNLFVTVERSNGDIEHDWILDNDCDHDSNKIPLHISFLTAILCYNKNETYPRIPIELWKYIYNICLETYSKYINLTLSRYNNYKDILEPCISVKKGEIYKKVLMDDLFLEMIFSKRCFS